MKNPNKRKGAGRCDQSAPKVDRCIVEDIWGTGAIRFRLVYTTRVVVCWVGVVCKKLRRDYDVSKLLEKPRIFGPAESRVDSTLYTSPLLVSVVVECMRENAHRASLM